MNYYSKRLNRHIEFDDQLAELYFNLDDLNSGYDQFDIFLSANAELIYGTPSGIHATDDELSYLGNKLLLMELQYINDLPKIEKCLANNYDKFEEASKTGGLLDVYVH